MSVHIVVICLSVLVIMFGAFLVNACLHDNECVLGGSIGGGMIGIGLGMILITLFFVILELSGHFG